MHAHAHSRSPPPGPDFEVQHVVLHGIHCAAVQPTARAVHSRTSELFASKSEVKGLSSSPRIALECAGGLNTFLGKHSESGFRRWHAETNSGLIFEVPDIAERGIPRGLAARCSNLQLCGAFLCIQSSKPFPTPLSDEDSLPTKI